MTLDASKFRTRQEFRLSENPKCKNYVIGLDAGYSSVKVFYESGCFTFPSYIRLADSMFGPPDPKDILYRDDTTGKTYLVGYSAQEMVDANDTNDSEGELFSRRRYHTEQFRAICNTALGLCLMMKKAGDDRDIVIQSGLPASYVDGDGQDLVKVLSSRKQFSIKRGTGEWKSFDITVDRQNVFVMPQPMGALYSIVTKNDGTYTADAKKILTGNTLVVDIGFGTMDLFGIKNRARVCVETNDTVGMHAVLKATSGKIREEYGEDIRVTALQKILETGRIICIDEENFTSVEHPVTDMLEAANTETMEEAIKKAASATNTFRGYQFMVLGGGTGEAWYEKFRERLSGLSTLNILPSNRNDDLPFIYSNARGYYMFRRNM